MTFFFIIQVVTITIVSCWWCSIVCSSLRLLICLEQQIFQVGWGNFIAFFLSLNHPCAFVLVNKYVHNTYAHLCVWNASHLFTPIMPCRYIKCKQSYVMHVHCAKGLIFRMIYAFFSMPTTWGMDKKVHAHPTLVWTYKYLSFLQCLHKKA